MRNIVAIVIGVITIFIIINIYFSFIDRYSEKVDSTSVDMSNEYVFMISKIYMVPLVAIAALGVFVISLILKNESEDLLSYLVVVSVGLLIVGIVIYFSYIISYTKIVVKDNLVTAYLKNKIKWKLDIGNVKSVDINFRYSIVSVHTTFGEVISFSQYYRKLHILIKLLGGRRNYMYF